MSQTMSQEQLFFNKQAEIYRRALGIINRLPPGPQKARHSALMLRRINNCRYWMARV